MEVHFIEKSGQAVNRRPTGQPSPEKFEFSKVLNNQMDVRKQSAEASQEYVFHTKGNAVNRTEPQTSSVLVGIITKDTPTVSHLLTKHPLYGKDCWQIVHSKQNQDQPFNRISEGAVIRIDPETRAISWNYEKAQTGPDPDSKNPELIHLGTISKDHPTVSHIMKASPEFRNNYWDIIYSEQNRDKPFTLMQNGTTVFMDPITKEISWNREPTRPGSGILFSEVDKHLPMDTARPTDETDNFSADLVSALKTYFGKPYRDIDCYGLVVRGLSDLGIRYQGAGGLRERLEKKAVEEGLPGNAYFTGEGLIKMSGAKIFSKSVPKINDSRREARDVFNEMAPHLKKGMVLSFSTTTHGHTGVISLNNQSWTYINSGMMDHQIGVRRASKGVGEELLSAELRNWFKLAAKKNEPLHITVGRLEEEKLREIQLTRM